MYTNNKKKIDSKAKWINLSKARDWTFDIGIT